MWLPEVASLVHRGLSAHRFTRSILCESVLLMVPEVREDSWVSFHPLDVRLIPQEVFFNGTVAMFINFVFTLTCLNHRYGGGCGQASLRLLILSTCIGCHQTRETDARLTLWREGSGP